MFEQAARMKLRFPYRGNADVEDLWDLDVRDLDGLYKELSRKARASNEDSLLDGKTSEDRVLDLQVSIVKHIVKTKLEEKEARNQLAEKQARKQQIMGIIEEKQNKALYDLPLEELRALID